MTRTLSLSSLCVLVLVGCGSFEDDMRIVCNAPNEVKLEAGDDPSMRATKLWKHIAERIRTAEAKQLFASLVALPPDERGPEIEAAALRAGITDCPFVELYSIPANVESQE